MRLKTWHIEGAFVASALAGALFAFGKAGDWREWVAALGVQLGFHHASVENRLQEAQESFQRGRRPNYDYSACRACNQPSTIRTPSGRNYCDEHKEGREIAEVLQYPEPVMSAHHVECVRWLSRYWIGKEIAWVVFFLASGAVSPLVGCAVFIAHPMWRRWYRAHWPRR